MQTKSLQKSWDEEIVIKNHGIESDLVADFFSVLHVENHTIPESYLAIRGKSRDSGTGRGRAGAVLPLPPYFLHITPPLSSPLAPRSGGGRGGQKQRQGTRNGEGKGQGPVQGQGKRKPPPAPPLPSNVTSSPPAPSFKLSNTAGV